MFFCNWSSQFSLQHCSQPELLFQQKRVCNRNFLSSAEKQKQIKTKKRGKEMLYRSKKYYFTKDPDNSSLHWVNGSLLGAWETGELLRHLKWKKKIWGKGKCLWCTFLYNLCHTVWMQWFQDKRDSSEIPVGSYSHHMFQKISKNTQRIQRLETFWISFQKLKITQLLILKFE